jgi:hypothetical protein
MPGSDALHSALTGTNIHVPYRFTYADAPAREAEAGAVPGDVGCLALQEDDSSLWMLTDDDPLTWVCVAQAGATAQVAMINLVIISTASGTEIADGAQAWVEIPWACTITRASLLADQSGDIVVDLWADSYANYPPTDADSITDVTPPTISSDTDAQDDTLASWTTTLAAGDILMANVDSCTDIEQVTISILVTRTA